jgi:hypothetical protein
MMYNGQVLEEYSGNWSSKCTDLSGKFIGGWKVICRGPHHESTGQT